MQTGEKTAISTNVYTTEVARAIVDKIRYENTATKGLRETLNDIVSISGTVMVTDLNGKLAEKCHTQSVFTAVVIGFRAICKQSWVTPRLSSPSVDTNKLPC